MPGDLVSGEAPVLTSSQIQAMWTGFETAVQEKFLSAHIPVAPAPGNHDAALVSYRLEYKRHWIKDEGIPHVHLIDATHFPFYYSYTMKNVFFIAMDDVMTGKMLKHPYSLGSETASGRLKSALDLMTNPQLQINPETQVI